jgi:hypothetical protein
MAALPSAREATLREKVKRLTGAGKNFVPDVEKPRLYPQLEPGDIGGRTFECELPGT